MKCKFINRILNLSAFPKNERRPFDFVLNLCLNSRNFEWLAFYNDGEFCGLAVLINYLDICHIIYFAVKEDMRNRGLGSPGTQCHT